MIVLDTTTRSLEIDLNGAVTTNQLPFVASYVDINQSTFAMSAMSTNTGASNSTTAVTLVAAPGATTSRQLKYLSIRNADTVATLLWVQLNDNSTLREIWKGTLAVGDTLVYLDSLGFNVLDSSGGIKSSLVNTMSTLTLTSTLTMSGTAANLALGANFISYGGTDAGLSLDASNNATLSGNLTVSGTGPHAIGGATNSLWQLDLKGTAPANTAGALHLGSTINAAVAADCYQLVIEGTINEAASGVHNLFAGAYIGAPIIGAGAGATTNAATLYLAAAPTGATNNYSLWIDDGLPRIDSSTGAGAGVGTITNTPNAGGGNPAVYFLINLGGTSYAVPGWAL